MTNDILYSFRRCPYALRVRWALLICEIKVEIREIDLKNKPLDFLNNSKTKTVPILIKKWNELLAKNKYFFGDSPTIADWSIWPFVRQFRIACESQKRTDYFEYSIKNWLDSFEKNREFKSLMYKYQLWKPHSIKNYFPFN